MERMIVKLKPIKFIRVLSIIMIIISTISGFCYAEQEDKKVIQWSDSYQAGIDKAKAEKLPVLIKFEAAWCTWCKKLDQEVFTQPEIIKEMGKYVCLRVDVDKSTDIAAAYKIRSLPRIIVINVYDEIVGDWLGYRDAAAFSKLFKDVTEYTDISVGTTKMPVVTPNAGKLIANQEIPKIDPNNTNELIDLLGHRNPAVNRILTEALIMKGSKILPLVEPSLENTYLGTRVAGWKVFQTVAFNQYKFDPWASSDERAEAIKIIKVQLALNK
jgi:thioredoxin-related protein